MKNVHTLDKLDIYQKKSSSFGRLPYIFTLGTILSITNPMKMYANTITDENLQNVEVVQDSNIFYNIYKRIGVNLPDVYKKNFKFFVSNDEVLQDEDAIKFTEDFIVKQMQSGRGISKQNQLLFIWDAIYEQITNKNIYIGEDGDSNRLKEFESVMDKVEQCGKDYKIGFNKYMNEISTDAQRRSADARQKIIKVAESGLNELIRFYRLYKKDPSSVSQEQLKESKEIAEIIVQNCRKYNINYKTKLSPEIRRFYGIE